MLINCILTAASLDCWTIDTYYQPILGILSVALEPLTIEQIRKFGNIPGDRWDLVAAIDNLRQFLDKLDDRYRLYHTTLPEFLTSHNTQADYSYCYVDPVFQNRCIIKYFQAGKSSWEKADLRGIVKDSYGRRHLARHLVKAEQVNELHTLLNLEQDKKNIWFKLKDDEGATDGFLGDIRLAWAQADKTYDDDPEKSVALQCRYALIEASVNSLAMFPKELMAALVKHQLWKPNKALTYASQIPYPERRCEAFVVLISQLPKTDPLVQEILELTLEKVPLIEPESSRTKVLVTLVNELPQDLLLQVLDSSLQFLENARNRAEILKSLAKKGPVSLFSKILERTHIIESEPQRADILEALAKRCPTNFFQELLNAAVELQSDSSRARVLIGLLNSQQPSFSKILEATHIIESESEHADILEALAKRCPTNFFQELLDAVIELRSDPSRARVLIGLLNSQQPSFSKILEATHIIESESERADILEALAERCPSNFFQEVLDTALKLQNASCRAKILINLAKQENDLYPLVLNSALKIQDDKLRAQILIALVSHLPRVFPQALEAVLDIDQRGGQQIQALKHLESKLSEPLPQALKSYLSSEEEHIRTDTIIELTKKKLPFHWLPAILDSSQTIQNVSLRAKALISLSERLPEIYPQALKTALLVQKNDEEFDVVISLFLNSLQQNFPILKKNIATILELEDKGNLAELLETLSNEIHRVLDDRYVNIVYEREAELDLTSLELDKKLPDDILSYMVTFYSDEINPYYGNYDFVDEYCLAYVDLVRQLPSSLFPEVLSEIKRMQDLDKETRADVLMSLANRTQSPDLLIKIIDVASLLEEYEASVLSVALDKSTDVLLKIWKQRPSLIEELPSHKTTANAVEQYFDTALRIEDEEAKFYKLIAAIRYVPESLMPQVVETTLTLQNRENRTQIISALADRLPPSLLIEVLDKVLSIKDENLCVRVINSLEDKQPLSKFSWLSVKKVVSFNLLSVNKIRDFSINLLVGILAFLLVSITLLFTMTTNVTSKIKCFLAIAMSKISQKFLPTLSLMAVAISVSIKNEEYRTRALINIIPQLSPDLLQQALEAALEIQNKRYRVQVLAVLAGYLSPNRLSQIITAALAIREEEPRAYILQVLASNIPIESIQQVSNAILAIQDDATRTRAMIPIAARLPKLTPQTLELVISLKNESDQAEVFKNLIPILPSTLLPKALEVIIAMKQESYRSEGIASFGEHAPPELLPRVLTSAQAISADNLRAETLKACIPSLTKSQKTSVLWRDLLHALSCQTRPSLLSDMIALTPMIKTLGNKTATKETARAIQDVSRWWP